MEKIPATARLHRVVKKQVSNNFLILSIPENTLFHEPYLRFCQQNKGMEIFAWCIMTNHVHLIFRSASEQKPELLIGDFKRFTSKAIVKAIIENPRESRKDFLLELFLKAGKKSSNVDKYQFWRHDNNPIELWSNKVIDEKIDCVHDNPDEEGLVFRAEDYLYSSTADYAGEKGILENVIVVK